MIEILREQDNYSLNKDYGNVITTTWQSYDKALTYDMAVKILARMKELKLIEILDGKISSPSLLKRMEKVDELRRARSIAGKKGAMAKWQTDGKPMALKEVKEVKEVKKNKDTPLPPKCGTVQIPEDLLDSESEIKDWLEYKRQRGQMYKPKGLEALWRSFRAIPKENRRASVDQSMANNWAGLFLRRNENGQQGINKQSEVGKSERADSKFAGIIKTIQVD